MESHIPHFKNFESLAQVPAEQLEWLQNQSRLRHFEDGEIIVIQGDPIDGPYFVIEGHVRLFRDQGADKQEVIPATTGAIFGYLPYSRGTLITFSAQSKGKSSILHFPITKNREMIRDHFELTQALVHQMSNRVRDFTRLELQTDKMAALGKLAAGLAHELNNPASALVSDSVSLRQHLRMEPYVFKDLTSLQLEPQQVDGVNEILLKIIAEYKPGGLTLKERLQKEELIAGWLENHNIGKAEEMSEVFTDFNINCDHLDSFKNFLPAAGLNTIFNWILNVLVTEKIVLDIQVSSGRITELIKSVKIYTHMDRGTEKTMIDVHDGIRNTITILGHKFREENVALSEVYGKTLPLLKAYPGELNQVWTNLIDNALDSLQGTQNGVITISTELDLDFIKITVADNGPGIPQDIQLNIFDPFFTTKELGKGIGMGLETVRRIVLRHKGLVKVISESGNTKFEVCLPINGNIEE